MAARRCVIIGDVIGSKSVEDRTALKTRLDEALAQVNEEVSARLVAPFQPLKGVDELGGVLQDLRGAYRAVRVLTEGVHPVEIRFAIVWGTIDIGATGDTITEMDGPAFHEADETIAALREQDRYVSVVGDRPQEQWVLGLITDQIELLLIMKHELTERQMEFLRAYRDVETLAPVASRFDVSVQSVSKTLQRAKSNPTLRVESNLEEAIARVAEAAT